MAFQFVLYAILCNCLMVFLYINGEWHEIKRDKRVRKKVTKEAIAAEIIREVTEDEN